MDRGKNKYQNPYTIKDIYKSYKNKHKDLSVYLVDYNTFKTVLTEYYKGITDVILDKGLPFKLPCNLGTLQIIKKKMFFSGRLLPTVIDWVNTVKYNKVIHYDNEHSDGYKYLFKWNRTGTRIRNITKYKFQATRDNKRALAYKIKNKIRDYFED